LRQNSHFRSLPARGDRHPSQQSGFGPLNEIINLDYEIREMKLERNSAWATLLVRLSAGQAARRTVAGEACVSRRASAGHSADPVRWIRIGDAGNRIDLRHRAFASGRRAKDFSVPQQPGLACSVIPAGAMRFRRERTRARQLYLCCWGQEYSRGAAARTLVAAPAVILAHGR
jgi:hypothetical protein